MMHDGLADVPVSAADVRYSRQDQYGQQHHRHEPEGEGEGVVTQGEAHIQHEPESIHDLRILEGGAPTRHEQTVNAVQSITATPSISTGRDSRRGGGVGGLREGNLAAPAGTAPEGR